MKFIGALLELKKLFDQHDSWSTLNLAIAQDYRFWFLAYKEGLLNLASKQFSSDPETWTPGAISLLSTKDLVGTNIDFSKSIEPLPEKFVRKSIQFASSIKRKSDWNFTKILDLCLLALNLRELWLANKNWSFLDQELAELKTGPYPILACLFGLVPDQEDLFIEIAQPWANRYHTNLAIKTLFSNPLPEQKYVRFLENILEKLSLEHSFRLLRELHIQRPSLAEKIDLSRYQSLSLTDDILPGLVSNKYLQPVAQSLQSAEFHKVIGDYDTISSELINTLEAITKLEAEIAAEVARANSPSSNNLLYERLFKNPSEVSPKSQDTTQQNNAIQYWKKALQLQPDEPSYIAQLALSLIDTGRYAEAKLLLEADQQAKDDKTIHSDLPNEHLYPLIKIPAALLAIQNGDIEYGKSLADETLNVIQNHSYPPGNDDDFINDLTHLITLFLGINAVEQMATAAKVGISIYPYHPDFLLASAYADYQLGKYQSVGKNLLVYTAIYPDQPEVAKIFILALEKEAEWESAYENRERMLENQEDITDIDYANLAYCALKSKKPNITKNICKKLQASEDDAHKEPDYQAWIHWLLGEAELALGANSDGLSLLDKSLQLDPTFPKPWLSIATHQVLLNETTQAEQTLRKAWQALPDVSEIQLAIGKLFFDQNQQASALPHFKKAEVLNNEFTCPLKGDIDLDWQKPTWERVNELETYLVSYARTLLALGYTSEARKLFERIYHPLDEPLDIASDVLFDYAKTLASLGEFDKAAPVFETVASSNLDDPDIVILYGKAINHASPNQTQLERGIQLLGESLHKLETTVSADKSTNPVPTSIPHKAELFYLLAEAQLKSGNYPVAIENFKRAFEIPIKNNPGWRSRVSFGLGKALQLNGDQEAAIALFQDAAQLDKNNPIIQRHLSEAYLEKGLFEQSFQTAYTAFQLENSDLDTLTWFANQSAKIYRASNGLINQANTMSMQALERASSLSPLQANILLKIGAGYIQAKDYPAAHQAFLRVASVPDATIEELYLSAKYLKDLGDHENSIAIFKRILDEAKRKTIRSSSVYRDQLASQENLIHDGLPSDPEFYFDLGEAYYKNGDIPSAIQTLDLGIEHFPDFEDTYQLKAEILLTSNLHDKAIQTIDELLRVNPKSQETQTQAAWIKFLSGYYVEALRHAEQVLEQLVANQDQVKEANARSIAAQISFAQLRVDRAYQYLSDFPMDSATQSFLCIKAEIELDKSLVEESHKTISLITENSASNTWSQALVLRKSVQLDGVYRTLRTYANQIQTIETSLNNVTELFELVSISKLILELGHWKVARKFLDKAANLYPFAPIVHRSFAHFYLICAIVQKVCVFLDIHQHAPGEEAISAEAFENFKNSIGFMDGLLNKEDPKDKAERNDRLNSKLETEKLLLLGDCVFTPNEKGVKDLLAYIESNGYIPLDILVLLVTQHEVAPGRVIDLITTSETSHPLELLSMVITHAYVDLSRALHAVDILVTTFRNHPQEWLFDEPIVQAIQAKVAYINKDYKKAWVHINDALEYWDDEPRWNALLGKLSLSSKELDTKTAFEKVSLAIQLEPNYAPHYVLLSKIHAKQGEYSKAVQVLEDLDESFRDDCEIWMQLGENYKSAGNPDKADACFDKAINFTKGDKGKLTNALYSQGKLALETNKARAALERAKTIIHLQDANPHGYELLSAAYEALNKPSKAIAAMEMAAKVSEDPLEFEYQYLRLLEKYKNSQSTAVTLARLVKKYPHEAPLLRKYAQIKYDSGEGNTAIQAARDALRHDSYDLTVNDKAQLHLIIGQNLRSEGHLDQAIHHLNESIKLDPANIETHLELGNAHFTRREYDRAYNSFQKAIRINDTDPRAYYHAGMALKENNEFQQAEIMLRRAAKLAPNDVAVKRLLGAVVVLNLVHSNNLSNQERET